MNIVTSEDVLRFEDMSVGQCGVVIDGPSGRVGKHFIKTCGGVTFLGDGFHYTSINTHYSRHTARRVREVVIKC